MRYALKNADQSFLLGEKENVFEFFQIGQMGVFSKSINDFWSLFAFLIL